MPVTAESIDKLLPQTQCGLCGYGGCMPYAKAIVNEDAPINLCPPGGVQTLTDLGAALNIDPAPYVEEMQAKTKPLQVAVILEQECIGCTKCITACPVDAILGSAKLMHSVITTECNGCELCLPACPVDCIDLMPAPHAQLMSEQYRRRFTAKSARLQEEKEAKPVEPISFIEKKQYIANALARIKHKSKA